MTGSQQLWTSTIKHGQNLNQLTLTLHPRSSWPPYLMFFSCKGAKQGWAGVPASASLRAVAGGPVQADCTSIFFGVKLMFFVIVFFGSCSIVKVRHCEKTWSCSKPNFGHIYLVMWNSPYSDICHLTFQTVFTILIFLYKLKHF